MAAEAGRVVDGDDPASVARGPARTPRARTSVHGARAAGGRVIEHHPDAGACAGRVVAALATLAGRPGAGLAGPPVTVLTCFRNEAGHIDEVVAAVLAQLEEHDEYLLLDDQSSDGTADELAAWAAQDARVRLLDGPGINLSAARNLGFSGPRTRSWRAPTPGARPRRGGWRRCARRSPRRTPADLVVGVYDVDDGDAVREAGRLALFPSVAEARRRTPLVRVAGRLTGRRFDARRLDGRSMACTVRAWERAGGFDVGLDSSEDAVFGESVLASGGTSVLALDAQVTWAQPERIRDTARMYAKYGEWGARAGSWPAGQPRPGPGRRLPARAGCCSPAAGRAPASPWSPRRPATWPCRSPARAGRGARPATVALIPVMLALKDLAKAAGCLKGALARWARHDREPEADDGG